jgi:hypothetical protein
MIAFIGGTGPEGKGLALRFAMAGEPVGIGSRESPRAETDAREIKGLASKAKAKGMVNAEAASLGDVVFITVPHSAHRETVAALREQLRGKVVVDTVVPIAFEGGRFRALAVEEGSAAQQAQALLPDSQVVGAFHNLSASDLLMPGRKIDADVVVCADNRSAKDRVMALAQLIQGVRAVDGNGLECSRYVEDLTALLLNVNRVYKARSMVRFIGI